MTQLKVDGAVRAATNPRQAAWNKTIREGAAGRQTGTYHFEEAATETVELETETSLCRNR